MYSQDSIPIYDTDKILSCVKQDTQNIQQYKNWEHFLFWDFKIPKILKGQYTERDIKTYRRGRDAKQADPTLTCDG